MLIAAAALVAAGCGTDGSGGGTSGVVGDEGPLAWLPADTWLVATARVDPKQVDVAIETLDRLPAWSLAESFLPASDGAGLRRELLELVARESAEDGDKPPVTARQLEDAFGERGGVAITSADFASFEDEPPVVVWIEVDDEDAALEAMGKLTSGADTQGEHEGVEWRHAKDEDTAYLVRDGLLFAAPDPTQLETIIEVREGDESLADDAQGRAVIEGGIGSALGGAAVQTEPLLDALPDLLRDAAEEEAEEGERRDARQLERIAAELGPVLESREVDGLVPDWLSASVTIDETGLRMRAAWSNPRELADPKIGSRELVERMPADAPIVYATVSDGSEVARLQDAWAEVRDAYDLDLRGLASECDEADRWACDLGAELAVALLEDEELANAAREVGPSSSVFVQDLGALLQVSMRAADGGAAGTPTDRFFEFATSAEQREWAPPARLVGAAARAGIIVSRSEDGSRVTVRVRRGSPLARLIGEADPQALSGVAAFGIDLRALVGPGGISFGSERVDGITVTGIPDAAPSKVVPALEGDADTIADSDTYREVVEAAGVPDEVGLYSWVDMRAYVESIVAMLGTEVPEARRIIPTLRNNLADVPGIVSWSTREDVDGEQIGVVETVIPILE